MTERKTAVASEAGAKQESQGEELFRFGVGVFGGDKEINITYCVYIYITPLGYSELDPAWCASSIRVGQWLLQHLSIGCVMQSAHAATPSPAAGLAAVRGELPAAGQQPGKDGHVLQAKTSSPPATGEQFNTRLSS